MDREDLTHGAELTGLGVLATPYAHHAVQEVRQKGMGALRGALEHNHGGLEMAGLGILAAPSVAHYAGKMFGKKPAAPAQPKMAHAIPLEMIQAFAKEAIGPAEPAERALWLGKLVKGRLSRLSTAAAHPALFGTAQRLAERSHSQLSTLGNVGGEVAQGWRSGRGELSGRLQEGNLRKIHEGLAPHQALMRPQHFGKTLAKAEAQVAPGGYRAGSLKPQKAVFTGETTQEAAASRLHAKNLADAPTEIFPRTPPSSPMPIAAK